MLIRKSFGICAQRLRTSLTDCRIWVILAAAWIFIFTYEKDIFTYAASINESVTPWLFPFLNGQKFMRVILLLGPVFMFCSAPFTNSAQISMIMRAGRKACIIGNMLYIVFCSVLYYLVIVIFSILPFVFGFDWSLEWGKALGTLSAYPDDNVPVIISSKIIMYFSPVQAMWFTFLLAVINSIFLGFLIYALNSVIKSRVVGTLTSVFFVLFEIFTRNITSLIRLSPVSWSNLDYLSITKTDNLPTFYYAILMYALIITSLAILIFFNERRSEIIFIEEN